MAIPTIALTLVGASSSMTGGCLLHAQTLCGALPHLHEGGSRAPSEAVSRHWLAATYARLGQLDKARAEAAEGLRIDAWFTIGQALFARTCKRPEDGEHFQDGLREAGIRSDGARLPRRPLLRPAGRNVSFS